jgi:hypothetical protein
MLLFVETDEMRAEAYIFEGQPFLGVADGIRLGNVLLLVFPAVTMSLSSNDTFVQRHFRLSVLYSGSRSESKLAFICCCGTKDPFRVFGALF